MTWPHFFLSLDADGRMLLWFLLIMSDERFLDGGFLGVWEVKVSSSSLEMVGFGWWFGCC